MIQKELPMKHIVLPENQQFTYSYTGKFLALSSDWKHEKFPLRDYELIIMTEGELYLSYCDENFHVKKGEYLLLPPSNGFRKGYKEAYCSFYWMHFSVPATDLPLAINGKSELIKESDFSHAFCIPQKGSIPQPEKIVVQMKQLQDIVKNKYPAVSLNAMVTSIVCELYGQLYCETMADADTLSKKQVYNDIIDYIQRNLHRNLKITEIAKEFGYNAKYLSHLFSEIRGIPLKQYILDQKIDAAGFMLCDSDKPITGIAAELGFSDVHNFARAYKKLTGLTPSEYRNAFAKRMLFHE